MKRVLAGIGWFLVFFLGLWLLASLVLTLAIAPRLPAGADAEKLAAAVTQFVADHLLLISVIRWGVFIGALLLAVGGTLKGLLPGTRRP